MCRNEVTYEHQKIKNSCLLVLTALIWGVAALLMSLELVLTVLAGWLILDESMGVKELVGCGLIVAAIVLAQVPVGKVKNTNIS